MLNSIIIKVKVKWNTPLQGPNRTVCKERTDNSNLETEAKAADVVYSTSKRF